jgi:hypothetical protein
MMDSFFHRRSETYFPRFLYRLAFDIFALTEHWKPQTSGPERGRLFESVFSRYCRSQDIPTSEQSGSRSLRGVRAASGFMHENDTVIALPDLTVHVELKHLSQELGKNELLIFNQKGLDFLLGASGRVRSLPLLRLIASATPLTPAARRFAYLWGIGVIEPGRLPILVIHELAGRRVDVEEVDECTKDEMWTEFPHLVVPLQERMKQFARIIEGEADPMADHRLDRLIGLQRNAGDHYWSALERGNPSWLEDRFGELVEDLRLRDIAAPSATPIAGPQMGGRATALREPRKRGVLNSTPMP